LEFKASRVPVHAGAVTRGAEVKVPLPESHEFGADRQTADLATAGLPTRGLPRHRDVSGAAGGGAWWGVTNMGGSFERGVVLD